MLSKPTAKYHSNLRFQFTQIILETAAFKKGNVLINHSGLGMITPVPIGKKPQDLNFLHNLNISFKRPDPLQYACGFK